MKTELPIPSERKLLELTASSVAAAVPVGWQVRLGRSDSRERSAGVADAEMTLSAPDGRTASIPVGIRKTLDTRDVPGLRAVMPAGSGAPAGASLAVARYLSPRTREALATAGMSYLDATGNLRLSINDPGLFVLLEGADRDPWRQPDRPTTGLTGKPAARLARALIDIRPPWRIRALAQAAGTSLGSTSRVVSYLEREALLQRGDDGAIVDVEWSALLRQWAGDYSLSGKRRTVGLLAPRGYASLERRLAELEGRYCVSGSPAAARWEAVASPELAFIYVEDLDATQAALGVGLAPTRPNVLLIEPEDDYVFERSIRLDGVEYAAPSQVAVDLLNGPGRNPTEGQRLIEWMERNEDRWRGP